MFIVLEGIDGSGKSSVIRRLEEYLESEGRKVIVTAEPTQGRIGKIVAETEGLIPESEALLFTADRAHHTKEINDWLSQGYTVICDRYFASTLAYQSAAGTDIQWLKTINSRVIRQPDVTILLDIDPEVSLKRVDSRGEKTRFEKLDYLRKVRKVYLDIADEYCFKVIDADRTPDEVAEDVIRAAGV